MCTLFILLQLRLLKLFYYLLVISIISTTLSNLPNSCLIELDKGKLLGHY